LTFLSVSALKGGKTDVSGAANGSPDKSARLQVEGYVNQSGLITTIPSNIPEGMLVPYWDKAGTRRALKSEEINSYHVIPADYVEKGELIYINPISVGSTVSGATCGIAAR